MASYMIRGESLFIPFRNGKSISDSQCKPRMYKSVKNFEKTFPKHNYGTLNIELVEYAEVKHGEWIDKFNNKYDNQVYVCSECGEKAYLQLAVDELGNVIRRQALTPFCPTCGADMRGGKNDL